MLELIFPVLVALALLAPVFVIAAMLRRWQPTWWRFTLVRSLTWSLPVLGLVSLAMGQWAPRLNYDPTQTPLAALIVLSFFVQLILVLTLPLSALIVGRWSRGPRPRRPLSAKNAELKAAEFEAAGPVALAEPEAVPDPGRRRFLRAATAIAVPVIAAGSTGAAVAGTLNGARIRRIPLEYPGLAEGLDGLRILQLSDLHLGTFSTLPQLASTLDRAREHQPDLVVVTGDIADDLRLLPAAMVMISELRPPLGVYSCLGNHEYGNGVDRARDLLAATPGTLLLNFGMPLRWNGVDLFVAGVDDWLGKPLGQDRKDYMRDAVEMAVRRSRPWEFSILLSHRPWVFPLAVEKGVDLTLAGHTHGGQVGLAGRSIMDLSPGSGYSWGLYQHGNKKLYTTCGAGQWIPFRLGCPAEAPLFELIKLSPGNNKDTFA